MPGTVKEPRLELEDSREGGRWCIEYQSDRHDLVVEDTNLKQAVFVHKCNNCTLKIRGKVKKILVDGSTSLTLEFDSTLSGLEVYNSQKIVAVANGTLPTVAVVKTSRFQLDLSRETLCCEVVESSSSDINISYPKDDGGRSHYHVPEQTRTVWSGKNFTTSIDKNS